MLAWSLGHCVTYPSQWVALNCWGELHSRLLVKILLVPAPSGIHTSPYQDVLLIARPDQGAIWHQRREKFRWHYSQWLIYRARVCSNNFKISCFWKFSKYSSLILVREGRVSLMQDLSHSWVTPAIAWHNSTTPHCHHQPGSKLRSKKSFNAKRKVGAIISIAGTRM